MRHSRRHSLNESRQKRDPLGSDCLSRAACTAAAREVSCVAAQPSKRTLGRPAPAEEDSRKRTNEKTLKGNGDRQNTNKTLQHTHSLSVSVVSLWVWFSLACRHILDAVCRQCRLSSVLGASLSVSVSERRPGFAFVGLFVVPPSLVYESACSRLSA